MTAERKRAGELYVLWSRTLETHKLGFEEWLIRFARESA